MARLVLVFLFVLFSLPLAISQNPLPEESAEDPFDLDSLFSDPDQGILESENPDDSQNVDEALDVASLTTDPIPRVSGSASLSGGLGIGLTAWPGTAETATFTPRDHWDYIIGYTMGTSVALDVRPTGYTRFYTSLSASLNEDTLVLTGPTLGEMFFDYTWKDTVFFRLGKQSLTWGQGRLVGNPANLVSRVADGAAVRAFFPLGSNGVTTVLYGSQAMGGITPDTLGYAGIFDTTLGPLVTGLSAHYRKTEDLQTAVYAKVRLGSGDLTLESRMDWNLLQAEAPDTQVLAGFFWEGGTLGWSVLGEYLLDLRDTSNIHQTVGLGVGVRRLPWGGWKPGLSWKHAIHDGSGQVLLGIDGPFAPSLGATIAIPILYGPPGSTFRVEETDLGTMVFGLGIKITLDVQF